MNLYDLLYGAVVGVSSPVWMARTKTRTKVLRAFRERMGQALPPVAQGDTTVMIHAVSLGEMNATRELVRQLSEQRPDLRFAVSTTTDTGYARGQEIYKNDARVSLLRFPLDFSSAVCRVLDAIRPAVVVLMELEVWPNFMRQCGKRRIPVMVVNGRLTEGSYRRYLKARFVTRPMFSRLSAACVQDDCYAERFRQLGVPADRVTVTGTMKFDTAQVADTITGADELAAAVGLEAGHPVWVCGSTGPGEEAIILPIYRELLLQCPSLRLVIVPRKPERFDEVAGLITAEGFALVRRSRPGQVTPGDGSPVILGDTMGELRKFYSLATVVFVGRTLVDLGDKQHGSDMIEPAGVARPVIVGPFTTNFAEVMNCFVAAGAMIVVRSEDELRQATARLLADPVEARRLGQAAQQVVKTGKGATARHVQVITAMLPQPKQGTATK